MASAETILIVDDEPGNVDYLEHELGALGFRTASAGNGVEALAIVKSRFPDLILLDVNMPVMDGFEACEILKGSDETCFIPVIIMTALQGMEDRVRGIKAGADDFLQKPVYEGELLARIETCLRSKRALDRKIGSLRSLSDHLAKFVPSAVRSMIAENPEAPNFVRRKIDVSILFLDVVGYTHLSEIMAPTVLSELIEQYFSVFLDEVAKRGGDINETMGDGFMAIFQNSDPVDHARQAAEAALALLAATKTLNSSNHQQTLDVHIGIASGPVLLGSTQLESLHGTRWVFTAHGSEVNVAARLVSIAAAGQVLISPETARRIKGPYVIRSEGSRKLKNIEEKLEVFRLHGALTENPGASRPTLIDRNG